MEQWKILSERSVNVAYEGPALRSAQRYYWKVRVWYENDIVTPYSDIHQWDMGLLNIRHYTLIMGEGYVIGPMKLA